MRIALFILLAGLLACGPLRAADKLLVGLYLAEKHKSEPQAPVTLAPRLHQVFGYPFYKLLKAETINLADREHLVVTRKDFYLKVRPLIHHGAEPQQIGYGIYKDGFLIADGIYTVVEDTPLFITGPDFHGGQLIFVLEAK